MELFVGLALFGSALAIRLVKDQSWMAWVVWLALSLISFIVMMVNSFSVEEILGVFVVGSGIGFLGPEIWQIIRGLWRNTKNSIIRFLSKPKNLAIIIYLLLFVYALCCQPGLLNSLIVIAILVGAVWFIARPLWKGLFGGKK